MKKIFLHSLGFFLIVGNAVFAQQIKRCGTMENLVRLKQIDPSIETQMQLIEEHTQQFTMKFKDEQKAGTIYNIPVVVHVVYNTTSQNISTTQIQSQITVLNEDFRRLNADKISTPSTFSGIVADAEISFCLATVDPNGNATSGIIRKSTTATSFSDNDAMKYSSSGGSNAWPRDKYLNLWVCNLGGGLLGYAQFPGGPAATDGVVINYNYFGRNGSALAPYNKGRTATHEVGHWLNLRHIWGDASCGNDYVSDTPVQQQDNYSCPSHPKSNSCGSSAEMFMNYMDYTDDGCMNAFSIGQKTRMRGLFASGGARAALLSSNGCGTSSGGTGTTSSTKTLTIGTGTSVTGIAPYGTYYMDERVQFIITKTELVSAGYTSSSSYLKSLAFNVYTASSQTMSGFTIKMRHTTATSFGTSTNFLSTTGMSTVYSGNVVAVTGWNTHNFSTGFTYNGTDNLLVDICWNNSSYTSDSKVYYTSQSAYRTLYKKDDISSGGVCANTTGTLSYGRPNMKLVFSSSAFKTSNENTESMAGIEDENIMILADRNFAVYPNPATDELNVMFEISENNSDAEILIYDILGKIVTRFPMENLQIGKQLFVMYIGSDPRFANVKNGIYLCSVNVNGKISVERFAITK